VQLKALKVFCDVVQQRSFSRAADDNDISQSGASQLVQQLEDHLGVRLIDRSKRPFVLTPEGDIYYNGCRELVQRYFALEDKVRTMHQEVIGRVRVASIYSVGLHLMSSFITTFYQLYPKANVRLEYLHPDRVYESVEGDVADIGLVSYPKSSRTIEEITWRKEPMVLVCNPTHPLAQKTAISIDMLEDCEMVGFDEDLTIRREIDRVLQKHDIRVDVKLEFDNIETIKRAVEVGIGVSLLPEPTVRREVAAGTLVAVPLQNNELIRPLGIIYRKGKELSPTATTFIELLRREGQMDAATASVPAATETAPPDPRPATSAAPAPGGERRNGKHAVASTKSSA
jgi:DNA-binding transcriptional LysR family regulator